VSEVSERAAQHRQRQVAVTPQPRLARWCQRAIGWILLTVVVVLPVAGTRGPPWFLEALHLLIWWGGLLWAARLAVLRRPELIISPVSAPLLVLISYVVVRYSLAEVEPVARPMMILTLSAGLLFFLTLNNAAHRWHLTALVVTLVIVTVALVALAGWQALGLVRSGLSLRLHADGARAMFARPADLAGFLALTFPLVAAFFFFSRWSHAAKVVLLVTGLIALAGLTVTQTLSGWLGALAGTVMLGKYLLLRRNVRLRWVLLGGGVWLLLMVAVIMYVPVARLAEAEAPLARHWLSVLRLAREDLPLGVGPAMFVWRVPEVRISQVLPDQTRCEYLQVLVELGVLGLVCCGWLLATYLWVASRILGARAQRYSVNTPSNRYAFAAGALASVVALAAHGLAANPMQVPAIVLVLAVVTATSLTCGVHASGNLDEDLVLPGRRQTVMLKGLLKWGVIAALLFVLGLQATRLRKSLPAAWFLARAEAAQANLDWAEAELNFHRAWRFDSRSDTIAQALGDYYLARATWDVPERSALASEALRWYERAYTRNPYRTEAVVKMGRLHDLLGHRELAAERYQRALETDPKCAAYHIQLAFHLLRWGETAAAEKCFRRALQLDPTDPVAAQALERLTAAAP
jgi:hypothetical protein